MAKDNASPNTTPQSAKAHNAATLAAFLPRAKYDGAYAAARAALPDGTTKQVEATPRGAVATDILSWAAVPGSKTKFRVLTSAGARLIVDTESGATHSYRIGQGNVFERPVGGGKYARIAA